MIASACSYTCTCDCCTQSGVRTALLRAKIRNAASLRTGTPNIASSASTSNCFYYYSEGTVNYYDDRFYSNAASTSNESPSHKKKLKKRCKRKQPRKGTISDYVRDEEDPKQEFDKRIPSMHIKAFEKPKQEEKPKTFRIRSTC